MELLNRLRECLPTATDGPDHKTWCSVLGADLRAAADEIERLRAVLEVSQAASNAAVSKAQFQARTNTELNALHDTARRLRAELCKMLNDASDAKMKANRLAVGKSG